MYSTEILALQDKEYSYVETISKSTKQMCLTSPNYNQYIKDYLNKTQISNFKLPEIQVYPTIKNREYIPITREGYFENNKVYYNTELLHTEYSTQESQPNIKGAKFSYKQYPFKAQRSQDGC